MTISEAIRAMRRTKHRTAVFVTDVDEVDTMRLRPHKRERFLERCLQRDREFAQNFVGVYDRTTSIVDLREDVAWTAQRQER